MRRFFLMSALVGVLPLFGCGNTPLHTLGKPIANAPVAVVASLLPVAAKLPERPIALHGTMVEKCPASGCWLRIRDTSGTIKVDLRASGTTATDIPTGTEMTVSGTPVRVGDESVLQASGLTY